MDQHTQQSLLKEASSFYRKGLQLAPEVAPVRGSIAEVLEWFVEHILEHCEGYWPEMQRNAEKCRMSKNKTVSHIDTKQGIKCD